jgi:hypothetical protein
MKEASLAAWMSHVMHVTPQIAKALRSIKNLDIIEIKYI